MATENYLEEAIDDNDTSLQTKGILDFPSNGGLIQIESEIIRYTHATDNELLGLTRGVSGTSAASHAISKPITFLAAKDDELPAKISVELESPATLTVAHVDNYEVIVIDTAALDTLDLTLPDLGNTTAYRKIVVIHKVGGLGAMDINTITLAAGEMAEFRWNGSAWVNTFQPA